MSLASIMQDGALSNPSSAVKWSKPNIPQSVSATKMPPSMVCLFSAESRKIRSHIAWTVRDTSPRLVASPLLYPGWPTRFTSGWPCLAAKFNLTTDSQRTHNGLGAFSVSPLKKSQPLTGTRLWHGHGWKIPSLWGDPAWSSRVYKITHDGSMVLVY